MSNLSVAQQGDARAFLDALYRGCEGGEIEARAIQAGHGCVGRCWTDLNVWDPLLAFLGDHTDQRHDVYIGAASRRDRSNGTAANLHEAPAVWIDLDDCRDRAALDARLAVCPFAPTLVIASGLGFHVYWRLRESADLRDISTLHRLSDVLRRSALALHADERSAEPAKTLRLPGGRNHKYDNPPRDVRLLVCQADGDLDLTDLEDWLPRSVVTANQFDIERIVKGCRNDTLYRRGRTLHAQGASAKAIQRTLETMNAQQCQPPLDAAELRHVIHSVLTGRDRPDFEPPIPITIVHDVPPPVSSPLPNGNGSGVQIAPVFTNLGTVKGEPVRWLWPGRLPIGKGVLIAGDPGVGKSTALTDIVARLSKGLAWPDDSGQAPQGKSILLVAEDGLGDTIRPRVEAGNGDPCQVEVLTAIKEGQIDRPFDLLRDLPHLEAGIQQHRPLLVGVDPMNSYLGRVDAYRDADVRRALTPLLTLAERYQLVVVWIVHLTKNDECKALPAEQFDRVCRQCASRLRPGGAPRDGIAAGVRAGEEQPGCEGAEPHLPIAGREAALGRIRRSHG